MPPVIILKADCNGGMGSPLLGWAAYIKNIANMRSNEESARTDGFGIAAPILVCFLSMGTYKYVAHIAHNCRGDRQGSAARMRL